MAIEDVIAQLRSRTTKPFALNLWVSMEDEGASTSNEMDFHNALAPLTPHIHAVGGKIPAYTPHSPKRFEDQARVLLDANVPVFSFIYGIPPQEILDEARRKQIVLLGTATTPDEAKALEQAGVDAIVASGFEAGGHRGSFLKPAEDSLTGTFSLVPQVADAVSVPILAAGGIADARGVAAAFALGVEGVQIGTAFLACEESGASALHRELILSGRAARTGLTRGFTGRLARGVQNQLMKELNHPQTTVLPYPLQRELMRHLALPSQEAKNSDLLALWAGQSASLAHCTNVATYWTQLIADLGTRLCSR